MKTSQVLHIVREKYLSKYGNVHRSFICEALHVASQSSEFDRSSHAAAIVFLSELGMRNSFHEFATIKSSDRQKVRWAWLHFAEQVAEEEGK